MGEDTKVQVHSTNAQVDNAADAVYTNAQLDALGVADAAGAALEANTSAARLAAYEAFAAEVREDLQRIDARMDELQRAGKTKAEYRQLFAARMTLRDVERRLAKHGL